jgi:hypothetical protein
MLNLLKVIRTNGDADRLAARLAECGARFSGVLASKAGRTLPRALNGGDLMWRTVFADEDAHADAVSSPAWAAEIAPEFAPGKAVELDSIAYRPARSDVGAGRGREGIWRCLALSVDAGTPRETIRRFERDTLLMPGFVPAIRNWALCEVVASRGRRPWTHVWEQEFDDVAGLEGDYMIHPIHWGLVDGWFDPECPQRIVDPLLIHAAFAIREAVIL